MQINKFGKKSIRIYKDPRGKYKGDCTITYETYEAATEAVNTLSKVTIHSTELSVKFAKMKNSFPGDPNYVFTAASRSCEWFCPK